MEESHLGVATLNNLLPAELHILDKIERSLYSTVGESPIAVCVSKLYERDTTFWYSIVTDYFIQKGVKVFCLVAATEGILLVPSDILKVYCKRSGWKQHRKGRSYYVRVKRREGRYYLFSSEQKDIDISETFVSA